MDFKYKSLDPAYDNQQYFYSKLELFLHRQNQAAGKPAGTILGTNLFLATSLMYMHFHRLSTPGFNYFSPTKAAYKFYITIAGIFFVTQYVGRTFGIMSLGDKDHYFYLRNNKAKIMNEAKYDKFAE